MKKIAFFTVAALAATSAVAADLPTMTYKAPPAQPSSSWTGCYIDAGVGYGMVDQRTNLLTGANAVNGPGGVGVSLDQAERGWLGRFGGGCDYQLGRLGYPNWLIGAFADYDVSGIKGFHTGEQFNTIGLVSGSQNMPGSWQAGGRLGYLVTPSVLSYFEGGWTGARFGSVAYVNGAGAFDGFSIPSQNYSGWFIGGGIDYAFNWLPLPGLFLRTEYRFSQYQSRNVPVITATGAQLFVAGVPTFEATKPYEQTVTTALVWRFPGF